MKITSHRELLVWQEAMDLAMEVFALSKSFPADERFSLTDQIRRSSRSVAANLSEAWRKRRYETAFLSKLNDAEGEAAETQTHLEIAHRCGYLSAGHLQALDSCYETLLARLVTMSSQPEKWILRAKAVPSPPRPRQEEEKMGKGEEVTSGSGPSPLPPVSSSPLPSE
jgi:four helix bundle protein